MVPMIMRPSGSGRPSLNRTDGDPGSAGPSGARPSSAGVNRISRLASAASITPGRSVSASATTGSSKNQVRTLPSATVRDGSGTG